jgi:hypothetical protein
VLIAGSDRAQRPSGFVDLASKAMDSLTAKPRLLKSSEDFRNVRRNQKDDQRDFSGYCRPKGAA